MRKVESLLVSGCEQCKFILNSTPHQPWKALSTETLPKRVETTGSKTQKFLQCHFFRPIKKKSSLMIIIVQKLSKYLKRPMTEAKTRVLYQE